MPLLDLFWATLWFSLFFAWLMLLFHIFGDIFRSKDIGGWAKALWLIFVIFLPVLGVLVYVLARGQQMSEREWSYQQEAEEATRQYIRDAAGTPSAADELTKLATLRDQGVLTDEEFAAHKAALLA